MSKAYSVCLYTQQSVTHVSHLTCTLVFNLCVLKDLDIIGGGMSRISFLTNLWSHIFLQLLQHPVIVFKFLTLMKNQEMVNIFIVFMITEVTHTRIHTYRQTKALY